MGWKIGLEEFKDVQAGAQRPGMGHVALVTALPVERLAGGDDPEAVQVEIFFLHEGDVFLRKVVAHDAHDVGTREIGGGDAGERGGAAQRPFHLAIGRFDAVQCHRTDNQKSHDNTLSFKISSA